MHELSLALEVCRLAGEAGARQGGGTIRAVGVEVGDDAGIEVANFRFCLEALLAEPPFYEARADLVPARGDVLRLLYVEIDDGHPDD
ncbi:MAG: hypothetical protein HOP28_17300 [Gemmatimonadales bacterium]|nr:hypothetical protein [Gemmatimonadales bacterium]